MRGDKEKEKCLSKVTSMANRLERLTSQFANLLVTRLEAASSKMGFCMPSYGASAIP